MKELRPIHFDFDVETPEELEYADTLRGQARTMVAFAQAMCAEGVAFNGMTRTIGDDTARIAVTSFVDDFGGTIFTAKIRVRLPRGEDVSADKDAKFPYLWVGRRTIQRDVDAHCPNKGSGCDTHLLVWEPGGQVAGSVLAGVKESQPGYSPLAAMKADYDGYVLAKLDENGTWGTDHKLVCRDGTFYQNHGYAGDGNGLFVPDREDEGQWWEEEVWCDPADGDHVNTGAFAWSAPFDANADIEDRALGALPTSPDTYPDGVALTPFKGEFLPGNYLIRVLRKGDPCTQYTATIDEVKVVCGKLPNRTIDVYQIATTGQIDYARFTTPFGWYDAGFKTFWRLIPGGPCLDGWNQFSTTVAADPWGGSDYSKEKTPGIDEGSVELICSAKKVVYGGQSFGGFWSSLTFGDASDVCTPGIGCYPSKSRWQGWWANWDDATYATWRTAAQAAARQYAPKDCFGNPAYPEASWGTSFPAVVMVANAGYNSTGNDYPLVPKGWPTRGISVIATGGDPISGMQLYDTGFQIFSPPPVCCTATIGTDETTYIAGLLDYAVPPRGGGLSTTGLLGRNDYLWDPETNKTVWLNSTQPGTTEGNDRIRKTAAAMGAQVLVWSTYSSDYFNPDTGVWGPHW